MADARYKPNEEGAAIGLKLIADYHDHLAEVQVIFLLSDQKKKSKGQYVLGECQLITGRNAYLMGHPDGLFVITSYEHLYNQITIRERIRHIDHELCHALVEFDDSGNQTLKGRGHDFEEFDCIIERHGVGAKLETMHTYELMMSAVQTVFEFELDEEPVTRDLSETEFEKAQAA